MLFTALFVMAALPVFIYFYGTPRSGLKESERAKIEITGTILKGETLFDIFRRSELDPRELSLLKESMAGVHRLRSLIPGQPYKITVDRVDGLQHQPVKADRDISIGGRHPYHVEKPHDAGS